MLPRLYKLCAELMIKNGETNDASTLLREAITNEKTGQITPLFQLFSDIFVEQEKYFEAKLVLEKGLVLRPKDKILKFALEIVNIQLAVQEQLPNTSGTSCTFEETKINLEHFKREIEHRDFYKAIPKQNPKEKDVQRLFRPFWVHSVSSFNSEVANGRGSVDFLVTRGKHDTTLIEFKLASSSSLKNNIENQVEIYAAANNTDKYFTVIFYFNEAEKRKLDRVLSQLGKLDDNRIFIIDASNKISASKAKTS